MNVNYPKTISISLLKFALPLFVMLFLQVAANAQIYTQAEQNCFNQVQNKVAWNKAGEKVWGEANIRSLCKGTTNPTATISCFTNVINNYDDWNRGIRECSATAANNSAKNQPNKIEGETTYEPIPLTDAGSNSNKVVRNTNSTMQTISYTQTEQNCFDMVKDKVAYDQLGTKAWNEVNIRKLCKGTTDPAATISCFKNIISSYNDWNRGITECAGTQKTADSGVIKRTITIKNASGMGIFGYLYGLNSATNTSILISKTKGAPDTYLYNGETQTFGSNAGISINDLAEFEIMRGEGAVGERKETIFKAILPRNKDYTTFCYEVTGTYLVPFVKTCDGSPAYESKHISFKNEAGYNSVMSLTYYPLNSSTATTIDSVVTTPGYQTKLYLPLDTDTDKPMTLKVVGVDSNMLTKTVNLNDFDSIGSTCYKVWGSIFSKKINPCSENPNARTIKLKNNGAFQAKMEVTYDDNGTSTTIKSNPLEVLESDTVAVPETSSKTPIKIRFLSYGKEFNTTTVSANFTGELCYKLEGTAFAPTSATCDDTVGDTSGNTRQIRFQNEAGYDAQMIVTYFVDEVINGNKIPMPKTLLTGMINGLGGKFRLVTIPKNTSKGMPITVAMQGNATVKGNDSIFSTTLSSDFAASPQPCFKVWGTALNPDGGKCNQ